MRRALFATLVLSIGCSTAACGGAQETAPASPVAAAPPVVARGGGAGREPEGSRALRELSLRVPPSQSLAYRVKTKMEQPGRKVEQNFVIFLDSWSDGTVSLTQKTGDHERTAIARELDQFLPLPEGAQSTYTRTREASKDQGEPAVDERFERRPLPGGKEQIAFHIEKRRSHSVETSNGEALFDVEAMRYERVHITMVRKMSHPKMKDSGRETKQDVDVTFDAEASAARIKDCAGRREIMLAASRQPSGTANPTADIAAALSGQNLHSGIVDFLARGRPELVWRAVLAQRAATDRLRAFGFDRAGVPDSVVAEVKAAIRKSPSHPVAWLVMGARDKRFLPELQLIAAKHEDDDAREMAVERVKEIRKSLIPLATRIRTQKPSKRSLVDREYLFGEIDADRDRAALFDHVVPQLASASEDERSMLTQALQNLAKVSLGEDADAWKRYWESHRTKPYDDWLLEALADPSSSSRARAAEALGERPASDANRKALRAALEDKDAEVRIAAAEALAVFKDDAAVRPLLRALPDDNMRWKAVNALSFFSDTDFGLTETGPGSKKPEEISASLGRWLGWAHRRGIEPGF